MKAFSLILKDERLGLGKSWRKSMITFEGAEVVGKKHPETMIVTDPDLIIGKVYHANIDEKGSVHGEVHLYQKIDF